MQKGEEARAQFWVLYHGPMLLVQTPETANAMNNIADCLRKHCNEVQLRNLAQPLVAACQKSIEEEWRVTLAPGKAEFFPDATNP